MKPAIDVLGRVAPTPSEMQLLRAAVLPRARAAECWASWRALNDPGRVPWRSQAIFPSIGSHLGDAAPAEDRRMFRLARHRASAENQMLLSATRGAVEQLMTHGIEAIVVKGVVLASTAYGALGDRTMGDVDLVVGPDHFAAAAAALAEVGWVPGDDFERQPFMHAGTLIDQRGRELDMHRWLMFPRLCRIPEPWIQHTVPFDLGGVIARRFRLSDELVAAVIHGYEPRSAGAIRWPIDVARLVALDACGGAGDAFWADAVASAEALGVGRQFGAGLRFCAEELGVDIPEAIVDRLADAPRDSVLWAEYLLLRAGLPRPMRTRQFIDVERFHGRRPSPRRFAAARADAVRQGGGSVQIIRRRLGRIASGLNFGGRSW